VPPPEGGGWGVIVLTVAVILIVLLAGLFVLGKLPVSATPGGPSLPSTSSVRVDLCNASLGVDCAGNQIVLPVSTGGTVQNHSTCDSFPDAGTSESIALNFSTSATAEGAVIGESSFGGTGGFAADPSGFLSNQTDRRFVAWVSGNTTGSDTATVEVPSGGLAWCVVWYAPPAGSTITWTSDVVYTYLVPA
jgi:hypothetical protein